MHGYTPFQINNYILLNYLYQFKKKIGKIIIKNRLNNLARMEEILYKKYQ